MNATDQAYMNTYYCYLHKPTDSGKYEEGTLTISRDKEKGSQAVLELYDSKGTGYRKTDYRSTSMYFRIASAIVVNPLTKTPQFQNMVLSLRKLEP